MSWSHCLNIIVLEDSPNQHIQRNYVRGLSQLFFPCFVKILVRDNLKRKDLFLFLPSDGSIHYGRGSLIKHLSLHHNGPGNRERQEASSDSRLPRSCSCEPTSSSQVPPLKLSQLLKLVPLAADQACKYKSLYGMHISYLKQNKVLSLQERRKRTETERYREELVGGSYQFLVVLSRFDFTSSR